MPPPPALPPDTTFRGYAFLPQFVIVALLLAIGAMLAAWKLGSQACWQPVGEVVCRVETNRPMVALTFDDGPTPEGVDAILPILEAHDVRATFFLTGVAMRWHPRQAERLLAAGHELGNHTFSHMRMIGRLPSTHRAEVQSTDRLLREAGVEAPALFRPPYGKRLIGLPMAVEEAGYTMVTWDVSEPAEAADARAFADHFLERVEPGSIVLMHPMHGKRDLVAEALPLILDGLEDRGLKAVTVSELLAAGETPVAR